MDAVLILGALAWCVALQIGLAVVGDGTRELALTAGGIGVLVVVGFAVRTVPRWLRWRGKVRPRDTTRPPSGPNRPLKPAQVAAEAHWGVTEQLKDNAWVREVGQLSWRGASVFLVGDKTGLVVEPWFLARRAYVFDETCRAGPSPVPAVLNPGLSLRRKNGVLRVSQGTQVIDLAVPRKFMPTVALIGTSAPGGEPAVATAAVSGKRLAHIARADARAARRHAFFARVNALSKTDRRVAAACSLVYLVPAAGVFLVSALLGKYGADLLLLSLACLAVAGVYAGRVVFQEKRDTHGPTL